MTLMEFCGAVLLTGALLFSRRESRRRDADSETTVV